MHILPVASKFNPALLCLVHFAGYQACVFVHCIFSSVCSSLIPVSEKLSSLCSGIVRCLQVPKPAFLLFALATCSGVMV